MLRSIGSKLLNQLSKRGLLRAINFRVRARILEQWFIIPYLSGVGIHTGREPWMSELLARILPSRSGLFIDVGVNLGQTLLKVRAIDPTRGYLGFEPNPHCVAYVEELVRVNRFEDVTVVPSGLFTSDGILTLHFFKEGDAVEGSASLVPEFRSGRTVRETLHVPVVTWATAADITAGRSVGVVKIDVEGAELEVLTTLTEMLKRERPIVLLEVLPSGTDDMRLSRQEALQKLIDALGYTIHRVKKTDANTFAGLSEVREFGRGRALSLCDFVLLPDDSARENLQ